MNYYYDLKVNFQKNNCLFYEWCCSDIIKTIKKIPIIHITSEVMNDILTNRIKINNELINNDYPILFVDRNSAIVLLFDSDGCEKKRSYLSLDDEMNILKMASNFKNQNIEYEILGKQIYSYKFRNDEYIKNTIMNEIKKLIKDNNYSKLDYLCMEWFGKKPKRSTIIEIINNKLNDEITTKELDVYNLIKLSYKNV